MLTLAPGTVRKPNRRPDAIPPVSAERARYDALLELAAAAEGLFPPTPAEYAQSAGVSAALEAVPLWTA